MLRAQLSELRAASNRLRRRPIGALLNTLDRVVANWQLPDFPPRRRAEQQLPELTGFSAQMIRHGIPLLLQPLRAENIAALLQSELGNDDQHWHAPGLITHVLSGNLPGLAAVPIVLSLAIRSAALIKPAAGDPLFAELFVESLRAADGELADCVLVMHWRGGDQSIETVAFGESDVVVASGSDAAVAAIRSRVHGRFIGHGHKVSFALIGRECCSAESTARQLAQRLAYDVTLWDQQGCLSPQLCYLEEGGQVSAPEFARLLGAALTALAKDLPPRRLCFDEQAAIQRFRQEAEWTRSSLASPDSTDWSLSIEPGAAFLPTCLNRCLRLKVIDDLEELWPALEPHRQHLEATGVAVGPLRRSQIAAQLTAHGVHFVCDLGQMQLPPLSWRQGGRPRVGEWVYWSTRR